MRSRDRSRAALTPAGAPQPEARFGIAALAAVFALAWIVRLAVARELGTTALFRSPQLDALEFLTWAKRIAAGDWRLPVYPTHGFPFPFLLALWLKLGQGSIAFARGCQAALGALNVALAARLAFRIWRRPAAGWTAGLALALYGPLVFVDVMLWEETLLVSALLLLLLALTEAPARPLAALGAGLALGLAVAVRPTAIALLPAALWLVHRSSATRDERRRRLLALLLGAALAIVPAVALASRAAGTFLFVRGFGAINLWIGNDPAGGGVQNARLGGAWDRLEAEPSRAGITDPGRLEGFYLGKSLARAQADPLGLLRAVGSKLVWLFEAEEPRDNHSYFFFRAQSRLLALLPGFGLLLAAAAIGLLGARSEPRRLEIPLVYLAATALPVLVALVGLRYRLPMVLGWALLAAAMPAALARADGRRRTGLVLAGLAVFALAHLRRHEPTHRFGEEWALSGNSWILLGDLSRADDAFRRADAEAPTSGFGPDGLGRLRQREHRLPEAESLLREAVRRDPDALTHHVHLAEILLEAGRTEEGLAEFRAALAINPLFQPVIERLAGIEAGRGNPEAALALWTRLAEFRGRDPRAWIEVARLEGACGRAAQGIVAARRAAALAPDDRDAWRLLGLLGVEANDLDAARRAVAALEERAPGSVEPQDLLLRAALAHAEGRWDDADRLLRDLLTRLPGVPAARALLLRNAARAGRQEEAESFLRGLPAGPR